MLRITGIIALVAIAVGIAIAQYHINKTAKEIGRLNNGCNDNTAISNSLANSYGNIRRAKQR